MLIFLGFSSSVSYKGDLSLFTAFISGKGEPHLNETDNSSMCLRPVNAGGHDATNDSSPEVLSKTDFLQVHTQI